MFRSCVLWRQHLAPLAGQHGRRSGGLFRLQELGDAEIQQLRLPRRIHQDVRRLNVAVDDQILVRVRHRFADLDEQLQCRSQIQFRCIDIDGSSVDVIHRQIRPPIAGMAGI